jgi:hypothetical protein
VADHREVVRRGQQKPGQVLCVEAHGRLNELGPEHPMQRRRADGGFSEAHDADVDEPVDRS